MVLAIAQMLNNFIAVRLQQPGLKYATLVKLSKNHTSGVSGVFRHLETERYAWMED